MISRFSLTLLPAILLAGCAMFSSSIQESRTDSILKDYLGDVQYEGKRATVARVIAEEIERSYQWHEKKDPLIQLDRAMMGMRTVEIFGNPDDVREVREAFARSFKISTRYPDDAMARPRNSTLEFTSMREVYLLTPDDKIYILNNGDRTRLYSRELELYEHAYPKKAEKLKATILKDHPDIQFHPWE